MLDELSFVGTAVRRGRLDDLAQRFGTMQTDLLVRAGDGFPDTERFWIGTGARARIDVLQVRRDAQQTVAIVRVQVPARRWAGPRHFLFARLLWWYVSVSAILMSRIAPEVAFSRYLVAYWTLGLNDTTAAWEILDASDGSAITGSRPGSMNPRMLRFAG